MRCVRSVILRYSGVAIKRCAFFVWLLCMGWLSCLEAQISLRIVATEKGYMRWSPTLIGVEVLNVGGGPLFLQSYEGRSWLRFLVRRGNLSNPGLMVRQVQEFEQPDLALEPGETARFRFDLTPFYSIRELGPYVVQAVVRLPGAEDAEVVSDPIEISVVPGRVIWTGDFGGGTITKRRMSLLRHISGAEERLYAQIEAPEEGLVYLCRPIGRLTLGIAPQSAIDALGNWSILFRSGQRTFDYYEFGPNGELLQQEQLVQVTTPPRLVGGPGGYSVVGGEKPSALKEDTLRSTQPGLAGVTESSALPQQDSISEVGAARMSERPIRDKPSPRSSESADGPRVRRNRS